MANPMHAKRGQSSICLRSARCGAKAPQVITGGAQDRLAPRVEACVVHRSHRKPPLGPEHKVAECDPPQGGSGL